MKSMESSKKYSEVELEFEGIRERAGELGIQKCYSELASYFKKDRTINTEAKMNIFGSKRRTKNWTLDWNKQVPDSFPEHNLTISEEQNSYEVDSHVKRGEHRQRNHTGLVGWNRRAHL